MLERSLSLSLVALALFAPAAPAQQRGEDALRLRPGDAVRLEVGNEPALNGEYRVGEDGRALLPLVGFVPVGGLPFGDVVTAVRKAFAAELARPEVSLTPVLRIAVLGEVRQPGLIPVDPSLTLAEVVASAGGLGPQADPHDLRLLRAGEVTRLSLEDGSANALVLRSGDQLVVGRRGWLSLNAPTLVSAGASVAAAVLTALILR